MTESFGRSEPENRFKGFVKWMDEEYGQATIDKLRGYEQFVWQLGLILPVEYMGEGPIRSQFLASLGHDKRHEELRRIVRRMKQQLARYNFHVLVDGFELKKPVLLPTNINQKGEELVHGEWDAFPIKYRKRGDNAEGYLFFQPYRVRPMELRGIFARLKGIGVGQYDNTVFRSIRTSTVLPFQLTGELNLERGFDDSLNLDRSGFIETDLAYINLTHFLYQRLEDAPDAIIKLVWQTKESRRIRQNEEKLRDESVDIKRAIKSAFPGFEVKTPSAAKFERLQSVDADYAIVKVSSRKNYIAVLEDFIDQIYLVRVILAIDYVIRSKRIDVETAEQLRVAVREALRQRRRRNHRD